MPGKKNLTVILVLVWGGLFAASILLSLRVDGPRNLDTGFSRLDVLVRWQLLALGAGILSAASGILSRKDGKWVMLIGLGPLIITGLIVVAIILATFMFNRPDSASYDTRPKTMTQEPVPQPGPTQLSPGADAIPAAPN